MFVELLKADLLPGLVGTDGFVVSTTHAADGSPHLQRLLQFIYPLLQKASGPNYPIQSHLVNSSSLLKATDMLTQSLKHLQGDNCVWKMSQDVISSDKVGGCCWCCWLREWQDDVYNQKLRQVMAESHYAITTFSSCSEQECVSNIVQICLVGLLIAWLIFEFVMQIKLHMRLQFSWQEVLFVQIFLCLSFNICFTLYSDVIIWYVLESLIFQIYFTTLVYYFAMKYFQKTIKLEDRKPYIVTLIIVYVVFCLSELGIFIALVNQNSGRCKQIGEIVINGIMIVLGMVFFYLAYRNETQQMKKFQEFQVKFTGKNPLRDIWIWVCCNIIGQIVSEVQSSLIYSYYGHNQCIPIEGNLESSILSCLFLILTYVISFGSTLWFYHKKRLSEEQRFQMNYSQLELSSAQADVDNKVEIVKYSSFNDTSSFRNSLMQPFI